MNMRSLYLPGIVTFACCMSFNALAAEYKGEAELGLMVVNGNSESEAFNGKVSLTTEYDKWKHLTSLAGTNTSSNDVRSTERYLFTYKGDYKFREYDYFYGTVSYEDDHFSGFDYRATESVGYGRNVIHEESLTLDAEIGIGSRQSKEADDTGTLTAGTKDTETIGRLYGNLGWKISDTSTFGEEVTVEGGDTATISKSITSLKTRINGSLAMKVSFTARHTSEVPIGKDKTDTQTTVNLVYGF